LANVARSYLKNKSGTLLLRHGVYVSEPKPFSFLAAFVTFGDDSQVG